MIENFSHVVSLKRQIHCNHLLLLATLLRAIHKQRLQIQQRRNLDATCQFLYTLHTFGIQFAAPKQYGIFLHFK